MAVLEQELEQEVVTQSIEAVQSVQADADAGWQDALQRRKQWTHEECLQLEEMGLLTERYELLDGEIVFKMGQNLPHMQGVMRVLRALSAVFGIERLLSQLPIMLNRKKLPEPDATVLTQAFDSLPYLATGADALLVVEVSDATLRTDRGYKMLLYARAGIAEYWIVNISQRQLEVYHGPGQDGYADVLTLAEDGSISPLAAPDAMIAVKDLLP